MDLGEITFFLQHHLSVCSCAIHCLWIKRLLIGSEMLRIVSFQYFFLTPTLSLDETHMSLTTLCEIYLHIVGPTLVSFNKKYVLEIVRKIFFITHLLFGIENNPKPFINIKVNPLQKRAPFRYAWFFVWVLLWLTLSDIKQIQRYILCTKAHITIYIQDKPNHYMPLLILITNITAVGFSPCQTCH